MCLRSLLLVFLMGACLAPATSSCEPDQGRPAPARNLVPAAGPTELPPFDASQSAGFFVGVRRFRDDETLPEVPFAVDDAVDLAHRFSLGSTPPLVPPDRIVLALSGAPQKIATSARLDALIAAGARVIEAFPADIKDWLEEQATVVGEAGLFVVAFATHGVEQRGHDYLLTTSSLDHQIPETSLLVSQILRKVKGSHSWRRLVILDACRENRRAGTRSSRKRAALKIAAAAAEGQVLLTAREGALMYDDPERGQGVFTGAVLDAMDCKNPPGKDGAVTLAELADFVDDRVARYERTRPTDPEKRSRGGIARTVEGSFGHFVLVHCP